MTKYTFYILMSRLDVSYSYTLDLETLPCQVSPDHLEQTLRVKGQTLTFRNSSPRDCKGVSHCYQRLSLPGGNTGVFLFFFLLIFSFSLISTCAALFDKGKELTMKAQEGKRSAMRTIYSISQPLRKRPGYK